MYYYPSQLKEENLTHPVKLRSKSAFFANFISIGMTLRLSKTTTLFIRFFSSLIRVLIYKLYKSTVLKKKFNVERRRFAY